MQQLESSGFSVVVGRLLLSVALLAAWQLSEYVIDPFWLSTPSLIWLDLAERFQDKAVFRHILATLHAFLFGFSVGTAAGVLLAFFAHRAPTALDTVQPYISALYSLPKVSLVPLFILWFGIGMVSKVVLVAFITVFILFWNTLSGLKAMDQGLVGSALIMGARRRHILVKIEMPSIISWVLTGMKVALPLAFHGTIAGEIFGSNQGLGYLIASAAARLDTTSVIATLVIVLAIVVAINACFNFVQRQLDRWR